MEWLVVATTEDGDVIAYFEDHPVVNSFEVAHKVACILGYVELVTSFFCHKIQDLELAA